MTDYNIVYICVRTYSNGKFMNKVHPTYCEYLSQAKRLVDELNANDLDCCELGSDRWFIMPIAKYMGPV